MKISNKMQSDERKNKSVWKYISMLLKILTPFRVGFGIACMCMSLLIIYSMFINNLDRFYNSKCGFSCGYLMDNSSTYFNPLDSML